MSREFDLKLQARTRAARDDPQSTHELVAIALTESDEHAAWDAITTLHFRATSEVFDVARALCASECAQERGLGCDILGQLGIPDRRFPAQSAAILLHLLKVEKDETVLYDACIALGHLHDASAIPALCRLRSHASSRIRYGVVFALHGFEDELAVQTLIELSHDANDVVRDWATFGLGTQIDSDTPFIRGALWERVSDPDESTRGEALGPV